MKIKTQIKKIVGERNAKYFGSIVRYNKKELENSKYNNKKFKFVRVVKSTDSYVEDLSNLLKKIKFNEYNENDMFYYSIDTRTRLSDTRKIENLTIDYKKILDNSLNDLRELLKNNGKDFYKDEIETIKQIENLAKNEVIYLKNLNAKKEIIDSISGIINRKCNGFYDAIQRILFFNQLMWQTNHALNGLGRLDVILGEYYSKDINHKMIDNNFARNCINNFLKLLHRDYKFKSNELVGDTGQIIILGGKNKDGSYFYNELTNVFIEEVKKLKYPDPKILLRVTDKTPRELIEKSVDCLKTGIGCPLFANDDVIIEKLIKYGYDDDLAYNYVTAACWEPSILGHSIGLENIEVYNFMVPFNNVIEKNENIDDLDHFLELYKEEIKEYTKKLVEEISDYNFEKDTILSLFVQECIDNSKDISQGGSKYNDFGLTGVGLANVINSMYALDNIAYREGKYIYRKFRDILKNNYNEKQELIKEIKDSYHIYGKDIEFAIRYSNIIINAVSDEFNKYNNKFGGKFKFGLSAPSYIKEAKNFPASFDGRKYGEPFEVHISSDSSNAYTELVNFASKLDYNKNRFNGNVIDFFVSPNFIEDNFDKFVDFIIISIKVGFFEMQMNVVSSKILIEARKEPEKFPDLIVRVWGFSAYFKDLPDEYKDYLIERAIKSENYGY